jgi:DNA helicase-2/ATP-dependent DNA helicase PcrA
MRTPTEEQKVILDAKDVRVRVVRAVPGSGKTWLVAEVIRAELEGWQSGTSGIAALSFTRVGGDEIRKAIGHDLGHPHFVGTIDAFLFRYVIRPYLCRVFTWFARPRIAAGEWGAERWGKCGPGQSATVAQGRIKLFGCVYIGEENGEPVIAHKSHPAQPLVSLTGADLHAVNAAKTDVWKKRGLLTHSDAALWASKILGHPTLGVVIRTEIARRFPFLIVDELQDTGHFLGKCIRTLFLESAMRGVLVGDPDQAIYEFTGARPDLFATFESIVGAVTLPLASSRRCAPTVSTAATHLKDSGGVIGPAHDRTGRALLIRYSDMVPDVRKIVATIVSSRTEIKLKVIARATTTVQELSGRSAKNAKSLHCAQITHLYQAVLAFRRGKNISALAAALAALELTIFQYEGVSDEELAASNIVPSEWKALAIRCLLKVDSIPVTGNFFDWQTSSGQALDDEISNCGLGPHITFVKGKLKPQKRTGWDTPFTELLPQSPADAPNMLGVSIQTVHAVKGETHDVTIFVCPPKTEAHCFSTMWWATSEKDREERRIAFVAMTRTQGDLIVCVSEGCYERLAARRTAFVGSFECMTVDECLLSLGQSGLSS